MSELVKFERRGRIGVIAIDHPPVNALSQAVRQGLLDRVQELLRDASLAAGVIACKGRTFIAGADIREFDKPHAPPYLPALIEALEDADKPLVAAIHGSALGGGLELALGCHYRVAVPGAKCGLPEVKLGLLPGAGGTQRLPRVIGARPALEMIAAGDPIGAARALELGLVDEIVAGDLIAGAVAYAERAIGKPLPRASRRDDKLAQARAELGAFDDCARKLTESRRGYEAPLRCVEAVRGALTLPFAEGLRRERELFEQLRAGDQSKAQRHVFFAEREAAKIPDLPADTATIPVSSVAIVGAGTMGSGIAIACANAGLDVLLMDREQGCLDKGLGQVAQTYASGVKRGKLSAAQMQERVARVRGTTRYADLASADLVIEAVFEEMEVKQQVFAALDRACKPGAILATNTSTLDVNAIAHATARPESVIGLHFFSPANVMRLLEIVRGAASSAQVIATAMKLARTLDKVGVLVSVCHGFVGNRMLYAYRREALYLLEEGALPQQVDRALEDFGFALGPFAVSDLAGLDIGWRVRKAQGRPAGERYSGTIPDRLCEAGHYGQKTGQGFYRYAPGSRTRGHAAAVEQLIVEVSRELGIERRPIGDDEIRERCVYALINEGAHILDEGIALRASDVDLVWIHGYGFPGYRGGPMFYAQRVGLAQVYDVVGRLRARHGEVWRPAAILERLARSGGGFDA